MELVIKKYQELTLDELYEILKVRAEVFVVEQHCVYQDMDDFDQCAVHVFLRDDDGIQAYLRVIEPGKAGEDAAIGRVLSKKRRCGLGTEIVYAGIEAAKSRMHASKIRIAAQTYVRSLYENIAFKQSSEEFMEDGIPHIEMILSIDQKNLV